MSGYNSIMEYNKKGRILKMEIFEPNILVCYDYKENIRVRTSSSTMNVTNYLEVITQKKIKEDYVDIKKHQEGEVYDVTTVYDDSGNEIFLTRLNKKTNSIYRKRTIRNNYGIEKIWFEEHNNNLSMGFKVDMKKLLKKSC